MPEKVKAKSTVQRTATQTSLRDHFRKAGTCLGNTTKVQDVHSEHDQPKAVSMVESDISPPLCLPATEPEPMPPATLPEPAKPTRLFPIFTKAYSKRPQPHPSNEVVDVDAIDIIDITSDDGLSEAEPPLSSTHYPSPRSEMDSSVALSSPPSPFSAGVELHHDQASLSSTSFPRAKAREHMHSPKMSIRKDKNRSRRDQGDDAPFPSAHSQHVRGPQRSYTSGQAPPKRQVDPYSPSEEKGSLDFLAKRLPLDGPSINRLEHIHRSLTHEQCEEYFRTFSRDYTESHPVFASIRTQRENTRSRHAEMWTRRFRPRHSNEVLGNEHKALYLRAWLSALQLHWEGSRPEEPPVKAAQTKGRKQKNTAKSVEHRGIKRPRIIRAVDRKRNKKRRVDSDNDLDDFVVFSDEEPGDADLLPENSEDEFTFCQDTLSRIHRRDAALTRATPSSDTPESATRLNEPLDADFSNHLTNTLLITGPPGCGKTAAVYACAEELGWDVFEVYPGVGRRNGTSLDHLVGDVGKNHIVQIGQSHASTKPTKPMALLEFSMKNETRTKTGFAKIPKAATSVEPISVDAESPTHGSQTLSSTHQFAWPDLDDKAVSTVPAAEHSGPHPIVRQSLVLLEEVDILFKEDAGFWPAVVDFIRHCRRPVVMTCNDSGLVPLTDLPLQTTLVFEPCPSPVAATFLQCLSLTEGCLIPHEDLVALYETTPSMNGLDVPDASLYPRTDQLPLPDLRRSITQLQMFCAGATHGSISEKKHQGDEAGEHVRRSTRSISAATPLPSGEEREWWRKVSSHAELLSHVDAQLCRPPLHTPEALSMACSSTASMDDEIGYVVLSMASHVPDTRGGFEIYGHDELIAEDAIRISRGIHEEFATGPIETSINPAARRTSGDARCFRSRVVYQSQMMEALQDIIQPPAPLMPQSSVFLDYIPWVRYMVTVDDILERAAWDGMEKGRAGRSTRNSMRTRHTRMVELKERQHELLMVSRLGCDE